MIRLLTFTTLYPNSCQPSHGIFVENRLRALVASGRVTTRVLAPIGYFPFSNRVFGRYGRLSQVSYREDRFDIPVDHPRYFVIPKVGMNWAPWLLYHGARRHLRRLIHAGESFDLIDAHYFYPDGVAAAFLAAELGLPFTVTARGSDVTLLPRFPGPKRMILATAARANGVITVSGALKDDLVALGVAEKRITVLRNGVDLNLFRPLQRETARKRWQLQRRTIASVGHLIPLKGHDLIIDALARLPGVDLLIVGTGPEKYRLETLVQKLGLTNRVRFLGALPHDQLPWLYNAIDCTVLASSREGIANVLLESMACGTPVAATNVGGTSEVICDASAGILLRHRNANAITDGIQQLLEAPLDRERTRTYAERFNWDATIRGQLQLFQRVLDKPL